MSNSENKTCPYCDKKGLAILPMRAAVARTDVGNALDFPASLQQSDSFKGNDGNTINLPEASAKYSGRLLRAGFLYVFNEVRGEWKGYEVTERGHLYEFMKIFSTEIDKLDKRSSRIAASVVEPEFGCNCPDSEFTSRCITIPYAKDAGKVWIGFSDTAWTLDVLKAHKYEATRKKHMQVVDVQAWVGGNTQQPNTLEYTELAHAINEFSIKEVEPSAESSGPEHENTILLDGVVIIGSLALGYSPHTYCDASNTTERFLEWAKEQKEQGEPPMIAMVADPVAITADLAALAQLRYDEFLSRDDIRRPYANYVIISQLEESIRNSAELALIDEARRTAKQSAIQATAHQGWRFFFSKDENADDYYHNLISSWEERNYNLTAETLEKDASKAWGRYARYLEEKTAQQKAYEHWHKTVFERKRDEYDAQVIIPLAEAHKAWLSSPLTIEKFIYNYDTKDIDSGAAYVQSLLFCIQGTQEIGISAEYYISLLDGSTSDVRNLIQRAFVFNQDEVALSLEDIEKGIKSAVKDVPWDDLLAIYEKSLGHLEEGGRNKIAELVIALTGPIAAKLDQGVNAAGKILVKLGLIANSPVEHLTHVGKLDDALDYFVAWMKRTSPQGLRDVDMDLLKIRLRIQAGGDIQNTRRRDASGRFTAGQTEIRFNRFVLTSLDGSANPAQRMDMAVGAVVGVNELPKDALKRFRTMFNTNSRLAAVGMVLDIFSINSLTKEMDEKTTMAHRLKENRWRYRSSAMSLVGGAVDWIHGSLEAMAKAGSVRLAKYGQSIWAIILPRIGKGLGAGGAVLMVWLDGMNAYSEGQRGNYGMAGLYLVSTTFGVAGTILMFKTGLILGLSSTLVGIIVILIGIGISLLIDYFKTDELQEWFERSYFGVLQGERYPNQQQEMQQFEIALKAIAN